MPGSFVPSCFFRLAFFLRKFSDDNECTSATFLFLFSWLVLLVQFVHCVRERLSEAVRQDVVSPIRLTHSRRRSALHHRDL